MINQGQYSIRPYARLLTMLGEQLIKNERIALMELVKNSYDADASWVKVTFVNFNEDYSSKIDSVIIIEDSGIGMSLDTILKHWLNPATPDKKNRKTDAKKNASGRILQGEKGIGRFAIFKLGRVVEIITKTEDDELEHVVKYDFSEYDDDFLTHNNKREELFLDELSVSVLSRIPSEMCKKSLTLGNKKVQKKPCGTKISITNLKGSWDELKVKGIFTDISRLQPIFEVQKNTKFKDDFKVYIYKDDEIQNFERDYIENLNVLLNDRSVIKIENGSFDVKKQNFKFLLNGISTVLPLDDSLVVGDKFFCERFGKSAEVLKKRDIACGSFNFGFYIFDFSTKAPMKYKLDDADKKILKAHRIYLYRDEIRVYPYGDPNDDWLGIDAARGTISAGAFLSNDQVVGYVNISQSGNPELIDKTNREGLIEQGNATGDFIALLQTLLSYLRKKTYAQYRLNLDNKKSHDVFTSNIIQDNIDKLSELVEHNAKAKKILKAVKKDYKTEKNYLVQRAETTEELAGVGLSVETASHDIMGIMSKVFNNIDGIIKDLMMSEEIDRDELLKELQSVRGGMSFIETQLKDIQLLFKSSKQRRKNIRIKEILEKVERIYKRILIKDKIEFVITSIGSPLVALTTDAVLLQLFLNLIDNSIYWLNTIDKTNKRIEIFLDGNRCAMTFSDNGPGIKEDDLPYIFEPFYSGKGDEGRGLGLYIARQLLERNDYSIVLARTKSEKKLSGANFIISFISEDKNE